MNSPFEPIKRLRLKRFRSVLWADIHLTNPVFVVGRNGAGKSNLLKALEFIAACMTMPLESVFQLHGGIETVRYRTSGRSRPGHFGMRVDFELPDGKGFYAFEIKAMPNYQFKVVKEQCAIGETFLLRDQNSIEMSIRGLWPRVTDDSLVLPLLGGNPELKPVVELLAGIQVYSLEPRLIQELQEPDAGQILRGDGSNLSSVLAKMPEAALERLCSLLGKVVPGVTKVTSLKHGKRLTLKFTQQWCDRNGKVEESSHEAFAMSDGTMRMLGIITAFLQPSRPAVIALEEPESTIHPHALVMLLELIRGFSKTTQIIVTTHSPELLESSWIAPENIRVATWVNGVTQIQPLGQAGTQTLKDHLMSAGEMMRSEGLKPEDLFEPTPDQLELFDTSDD